MPPISADVRAPEKDVFDILQVKLNSSKEFNNFRSFYVPNVWNVFEL